MYSYVCVYLYIYMCVSITKSVNDMIRQLKDRASIPSGLYDGIFFKVKLYIYFIFVLVILYHPSM